MGSSSPWPLTVAALLGASIYALPSPCTAEQEEPPPAKEASVSDWLGAQVAAAGSIDNGAFAFSLGARLVVTDRLLIGIDAEYNPWFSLEAHSFAHGAFNSYATFIGRYPVSEHLALRTTAHLGVSVLLIDLLGVPRGSVGPHVGLSLLGVSYEFADSIYLIVDPADVALPVPQITGAPFTYGQYRLTLGLQFGA